MEWAQSAWGADEGGDFLLDCDFPEVPPSIFAGEWREVAQGPWTRDERITLLKTRALLRCLQRAIRRGHGPGSHLLLLEYNLGCVPCVERFRAKSYPILVQIRQIAGLLFLHSIRLHVLWVPSERNASDKASRCFDPVSDVAAHEQPIVDKHGCQYFDIFRR